MVCACSVRVNGEVMANDVDIGGASIGSLLLIGKILEALVDKRVLTQPECETIVKKAAANAAGHIAEPVREAFKTAYPGLNLD
jgi:hypothetical protein